MVKKIYDYILNKIISIKWLDSFLLRINDAYNIILKTLLKHSFKTRASLYGEGGTRLSNDPDIHVYYRWPAHGHVGWAMQPSFNMWALLAFDKRTVLELGCANGWYYREFYSRLDNLYYVGCDISQDTIAEANRKCKTKDNALFVTADILKDMPLKGEDVTNVFWYASMCMFTKEQRNNILIQIKNRLDSKNGILSGSCEIKSKTEMQWSYYIGLLESEDDLRDELNEYFENILIVHTTDKKSLFFMASNGKLPFCFG